MRLSVGVLQGDTLAPYLFDIVIDYVLRNATEDETIGISSHSAKGTRSRTIPLVSTLLILTMQMILPYYRAVLKTLKNY
jgi:hypothetical protein